MKMTASISKPHGRNITQGRSKRKIILPTVILFILYFCFSSYRRPEVDVSLSLKEGPGLKELVNVGFSQVKDSIQNVEQRMGLRTKQNLPELKFRQNINDANFPDCSQTAKEVVDMHDPDYAPSFTETFKNNPKLTNGGYFRSDTCKPIGSTAIIIPFRDREQHLKTFLAHTHPILQQQAIEYLIIVVKQSGDETFNKNRLLNVGYNFAKSLDLEFDCFIFHDTDLLLENGTNIYTCDSSNVRHLCPEVDTLNYKNPEYIRINPINNTFTRASLFGGVMAFTPDQFELINGFSNRYWGWGMEDEDSYWRVQSKGLNITEADGGRYTMIKHGRDDGNPANWYRYLQILKDPNYQIQYDGLYSVKSKILDVSVHLTHTEIEVDIGKPEPMVTPIVTLTISGFMLLFMMLLFFCFAFNSTNKNSQIDQRCFLHQNFNEFNRIFTSKYAKEQLINCDQVHLPAKT